MMVPNWKRWALMLVTGCAIGLVVAGPEQLLGWDAFPFGVLVLYASAAGLLYWVLRLPHDAPGQSAWPVEMNAEEKWAWIRFAMAASIFAYLFWELFLIDSPIEVSEWEEVGDNLWNIVSAFGLAAVVLIRPGMGVATDERDKAISLLAARTALVALSLIVLVSAMIIGMDGYADLTTTRSGRWFEHYLMACLALAWVIESAVCVFHHWRDRR